MSYHIGKHLREDLFGHLKIVVFRHVLFVEVRVELLSDRQNPTILFVVRLDILGFLFVRVLRTTPPPIAAYWRSFTSRSLESGSLSASERRE